ncbi:very short patch repair endonuclease [Rhizobium binxianense]
MADRISVAQRSENMRRIRSKDTKPELLVRRMVYAMGYRYRVHRKDLAGKPDLAFIGKRKAIFVHGCFWHGHEAVECRDGRAPKSNEWYWNPKLARNKARDLAHQETLHAAGWDVLTIWDCETKDEEALRQRLADFLGN